MKSSAKVKERHDRGKERHGEDYEGCFDVHPPWVSH